MHHDLLRKLLVVLGLWLVGCQTAVSPTPIAKQPTQSPIPNLQPPTPTLAPTATANPNGWQTIQPGFEKRLFETVDAEGVLTQRIKVIRIDNSLHRFEIAYKPQNPQSIQAWQTQLNASLIINGSFFTPEYIATGAIIIDGVASGQSYGDFAGMVVINDGRLQIQDLAERPYSVSDPIDFGIQTFPVLVKRGGQVGYTEPGEAARRSVIGVDENGRILIIITEFGAYSLAEMSRWLVNSDLAVDIALNLDGGNSSSLAVVGEDTVGFLPIPNVIAVYPK